MGWMIFFIITGVIIGAVVHGRVYLHIVYTIRDGRDDFNLKIYLFNLVKIYNTNRRGILQQAILKFIDKIIPSAPTLPIMPKKKELALFKLPWICRSLSLRIRLGLGDASYTAFSCGFLQSIWPLAWRYLAPKINWKRPPVLYMEPDFKENVQVLLFQCILSVKIGHLLYILKNTSQKQEG